MPDLVQMQSVITEQGRTISTVVGVLEGVKTSVSELKEDSRETRDLMTKMLDSLKHQEALMARQVALDEKIDAHSVRNDDRFHVVNNRMVALEGRLKEHEKGCSDKCKVIEPQAVNGQRAYKALLWMLGVVGTSLIGLTITALVWAIGQSGVIK